MSLRSEFTGTHDGLPARRFVGAREATAFLQQLVEAGVSYKVLLVTYRKRLRLPLETVVIYLGGDNVRPV